MFTTDNGHIPVVRRCIGLYRSQSSLVATNVSATKVRRRARLGLSLVHGLIVPTHLNTTAAVCDVAPTLNTDVPRLTNMCNLYRHVRIQYFLVGDGECGSTTLYGVWVRSPQWGLGATPLVEGLCPLKLTIFSQLKGSLYNENYTAPFSALFTKSIIIQLCAGTQLICKPDELVTSSLPT